MLPSKNFDAQMPVLMESKVGYRWLLLYRYYNLRNKLYRINIKYMVTRGLNKIMTLNVIELI